MNCTLHARVAQHEGNRLLLSPPPAPPRSNCGNPSLRLFGFGPVVRDGFGIGYIIKGESGKFVVLCHLAI